MRERALAECLDPMIQAQTLGPRHPAVARSLIRLADGHAVIGDLDRAGVLYQRALAIQEESLGPDHGDVAWTLGAYATLLRKKNRTAEAAELAALVGLLIACGPMPKTITSDERARLGTAAQACLREHPIETYEIDRFGG
jgi:Tetratricopeptide repeat